MYFQALQDRIEAEKLTTDILYFNYPDEALAAVPEEGPCIIVMESLLPDSFNLNSDHREESARVFAQKSKEKNPNCKRILYSVEPFDLQPKEFDCFMRSLHKNSLYDLMKKLKEYCKN